MPRKYATDGSKLKKPKGQRQQVGQDKKENVLSSDHFTAIDPVGLCCSTGKAFIIGWCLTGF